jgi:hypothetical protein
MEAVVRFGRFAMPAEIGGYDAVGGRQKRDVGFPVLGRACEAMELGVVRAEGVLERDVVVEEGAEVGNKGYATYEDEWS